MYIRVLIVTICLVSSLSIYADGLKLERVPADAKWLIHIDYAGLSDSEHIQSLRDEKPKLAKMFRHWSMQRYGIDPPEDLKSVTMFSSDYRPYTGSVIIDADYEADKIEDLLCKQENYSSSQVGDRKLHTFTLKEQPSDSPSGDMEMTVVMVDSQTLLLASSPKNAEQILQLLAGDAPSLEGSPSKLVPERAGDAWVIGAAIDLNELEQHPIAMPVLAQHERIHWTFGKTDDGQWYECADFIASDEKVATKMEKVLNGVLAYESLYAQGIEPMNEIVQNATVRRDGKVTGFDWKGDPKTAMAAVNRMLDRIMTWKGLFVDEQNERDLSISFTN